METSELSTVVGDKDLRIPETAEDGVVEHPGNHARLLLSDAEGLQLSGEGVCDYQHVRLVRACLRVRAHQVHADCMPGRGQHLGCNGAGRRGALAFTAVREHSA